MPALPDAGVLSAVPAEPPVVCSPLPAAATPPEPACGVAVAVVLVPAAPLALLAGVVDEPVVGVLDVGGGAVVPAVPKAGAVPVPEPPLSLLLHAETHKKPMNSKRFEVVIMARLTEMPRSSH
jgi:hypothetical protein